MYVSGFKYREIADKLGLPLGTVKSRIYFTRQKLQQELKDFRWSCRPVPASLLTETLVSPHKPCSSRACLPVFPPRMSHRDLPGGKTFSFHPPDVPFSTFRKRAVNPAETGSRWSRIVRALRPNRYTRWRLIVQPIFPVSPKSTFASFKPFISIKKSPSGF